MDFCCCYLEHLPGCNLILMYRDEGGKNLYPQGTDFPVFEAQEGHWCPRRSGQRHFIMYTPTRPRTFVHELIHGVFGLEQEGEDQLAVQAGTFLVTRDEKQAVQTTYIPDKMKDVVTKLMKDRVGCSSRKEEFLAKDRTKEAAAALLKYAEHLRQEPQIKAGKMESN